MINLYNKGFLFYVGLAFILSLLIMSTIHHFYMDNYIPRNEIIYKNGTPVAKAPFPPSKEHWFGTDRFGYDLFFVIIQGAKYTLGLAIVIALLRTASSFLIGFILSSFRSRLHWIYSISESFYYLPAALICYFILKPVLDLDTLTFVEKAVFEIVILTLVAVPTTSLYLQEEINIIKRNEFIKVAKLMGGSPYHIFIRHILPHLTPRIVILYVQQVIAVLLLLAHLGLFSLFFGGSVTLNLGSSTVDTMENSLSSEWSGLIGTYYYQLKIAPWLLLIPVLFFAMTIVSLNFVLEGLKANRNKHPRVKQTSHKENLKSDIGLSSFVPVNGVRDNSNQQRKVH